MIETGKSKKRVVLAFGTFDILHPGHLHYLSQAKSLGNRLVVGIATDKNAKNARGRKPVNPQEQRCEVISALKMVDEAVVGFEDDKVKMVEAIKPDIVALGYDQKPSDEELAKELSARGIKAKIVRLLPYEPEVLKSSKIRENVAKIAGKA